MFDPNAVWHSYFLILWQSFYEKRVKSLEKLFFQLSKRNFADFNEISGNRCANSLTKIETSYIVGLLNGTNC